jgi:hypothetical protein
MREHYLIAPSTAFMAEANNRRIENKQRRRNRGLLFRFVAKSLNMQQVLLLAETKNISVECSTLNFQLR